MAGKAWLGEAWQGKARRGRLGSAGHGPQRQGKARQAGHRVARLGCAPQAWIGQAGHDTARQRMKRRRRTGKQRLAILQSHDHVCHLCGGKIQPGQKWELEHVVALELSHDDSDENLRPAHAACHREKTKADVTDIAKAKRREIKFYAAEPPKQKIKSRGFARKERKPKAALPPRRLFI